MKRFKVLQLQNYCGGSFSHVAEQIIEALPVENFDVIPAFLKGPVPQSTCHGRHDAKAFAPSSCSLKGIKRMFIGLRIYRYCREENIDLLIAHRFKSIHVAMEINRLLKVPALGVIHGVGDFDRSYRRHIIRRNISQYWKMVGVSRHVKEYLLSLNCGMTEDNTVVIDNAIDIHRVAGMQLGRAEARKILKLPEDALVFGTVGRLVPVKGHIHLLQALNIVKEMLPKACVAIIGEGRCRDMLESYIVQNKLEDRVFLLGEYREAARYVRAFDIFVMPSINEGLPLSLLEGMSASLPVIGSDIPSISDVIEGVGFIFRAGDYRDLSRRMLEAAQSDREAVGHKTFYRLKQRYDIGTFRRRYSSLVWSMVF